MHITLSRLGRMAAAGCAACFILVGCSAGSNADPAAAQSPAATSAAGTDGSGGSRAAGAPATPSTRAPRVSARSAPFQDQVRYADGISVRAGAARQDVVKATGPGQLTGKPVTLFTVVFTNRSTGPLDLTRVSVDVQYGQPPQDAAPVYDGSAQDFSTKVAPGTTAKAVYAFSIPVAELDEVTMRVRFDPEYGAATFVGRVSPPR